MSTRILEASLARSLIVLIALLAVPSPTMAASGTSETHRAISADEARQLALNQLTAAEDRVTLTNPRHRAEFTAGGMRLLPTGNGPEWRWRLTAVLAGGRATAGVATGAVAPRVGKGRVAVYDRGAIEEQYLARVHTVEQCFVILEPLQLAGEELVIAGQVTCAGELIEHRTGWLWRSSEGAVRLAAVGQRGAGARIRAEAARLGLVDGTDFFAVA